MNLSSPTKLKNFELLSLPSTPFLKAYHLMTTQRGFTLVELMVVVAIIGILSAIAVPNFKKYQSKAKQSEAKIQLGAIYSAEVSAKAAFDTYGTCLALMGYETPPRGYYLFGFTAGYDASAKYSGCNATAAFIMPPSNQLAALTANKPTAAANLPAGATASENAFTAGAAGSISAAGSNALDLWTINDSKSLLNTQIGY